MEQLTASIQAFGLNEVPQLSKLATFPTYNQVDIYRAHIAELLAPITGLPAEQIYPLLQWTQVLEYGDLMLPVPALRIKGKKPDALAVEIKEQVPLHPPTPLVVLY
jgi:arginyl-tRNA synthetase